MNKSTSQSHGQDEVDEIVDALVADPTRANDIKAQLRRKIAAPDIVRMVAPRSLGVKTGAIEEDTDDDIWDNVPV